MNHNTNIDMAMDEDGILFSFFRRYDSVEDPGLQQDVLQYLSGGI